MFQNPNYAKKGLYNNNPVTADTEFSSCYELWKICQAVGYKEYDSVYAEYYSYTQNEIAREEYEKLLPYHKDSNPPYHLIATRYQKILGHIRLAIEECENMFSTFLSEDEHMYMFDISFIISDETERKISEQIVRLIHPITLDFPKHWLIGQNPTHKYPEITTETPIKLSDIRYLDPIPENDEPFVDSPLEDFVDDEHWNNGTEMVQQVIYTEIYEQYIPETFYEIKEIYESCSDETRKMLFNREKTQWTL